MTMNLDGLAELLRDNDPGFGLYKTQHWTRVVRDVIGPWLAERETRPPAVAELPAVTRVEVIDSRGRAYSARYTPGVELRIQDDERTLKVFAGAVTGEAHTAHQKAHEHLERQLATPAPGWFPFGTHVDTPAGSRLEFWGTDDSGMPLWERPTGDPQEAVTARFGAFYTPERARIALGGVTPAWLSELVEKHHVLSVTTSDNKTIYPAFQFDDDDGSILPGLADVLSALLPWAEDGWVVAYWLTAAHADGLTAIDILRGDDQEAKDLLTICAHEDATRWRDASEG